jgi:short subunit dehydrogenase-like uncharacterized protein
MSPAAARRFDPSFGATGFTGRLVAEYLARRAADSSLVWASPGNLAQLSAVRARRHRRRLRRSRPSSADALDRAAMARVAAETRVVCTTVGPYAEHGALSRRLRQGRHPLRDPPARSRYPRLDRREPGDTRRQRRIVPLLRLVPATSAPCSCGASWPALAGAGDRHFGENGTFSGGTVASLLGVIDAAAPTGRSGRSRPRSARRRTLPPGRRGPGWDRVIKRPTAPFVMAAINTRIVRRSHALLGYPGADFLRRRMSLPRSVGGVAAAVGITGAGSASSPPPDPGLAPPAQRTPQPGDGPSADARARSHCTVRFHGEVAGTTLVATMSDQLDPGYGGTAKMLGESALCLAEDELTSGGGVLTPASAMGHELLARLMTAGIQFDVAEA